MDLINNMQDRELVMKEENKPKLLSMLRKFGTVVDYMTEEMVTKFYGVGNTTIKLLATRNEKELSKYGYKVYKKSEILKLQDVTLENIPNRGLRLYPIEAVIVIGMMLTESEVAEQLRSEIVKELFSSTPIIDPLIFNLNDIVNASHNGNDVELAIAIGQRDKLIEDRVIEEKVKPLENKVEELSPLANKYNIFLDTNGLTDIEKFSKNLSIDGMGRNKMYKYLRGKGFLMENNIPYQKYIDRKYFVVKPSGYHLANGEKVQDYKTFLTSKGVNKIIDELVRDNILNK